MYITGETHMYMLIHDNETQINVEHTEKAYKQEKSEGNRKGHTYNIYTQNL